MGWYHGNGRIRSTRSTGLLAAHERGGEQHHRKFSHAPKCSRRVADLMPTWTGTEVLQTVARNTFGPIGSKMRAGTNFISKGLGTVSQAGKRVWAVAKRIFLCILPWFGGIALLLLLLSFTSLPYHMHRWLGIAGGITRGPVNSIIVLGGSGMPSGPELLRLHYAAEVAADDPSARILIVHPLDTTVAELMAKELTIRGVDPARISLALEGTNTREQALLLTEQDPTYKTKKSLW